MGNSCETERTIPYKQPVHMEEGHSHCRLLETLLHYAGNRQYHSGSHHGQQVSLPNRCPVVIHHISCLRQQLASTPTATAQQQFGLSGASEAAERKA